MAHYLIDSESWDVTGVVSNTESFPGRLIAEGADGIGDLTALYYDGREVKIKPDRPTATATWNNKETQWQEPEQAGTVVLLGQIQEGLNRPAFLAAIIETQTFRHISYQASMLGGAIQTELNSLKALINVSPSMMPDENFSSKLQRSFGRAKDFLAASGVPWNDEHLIELNLLLKNTLGVEWQV